MAETHLDHPGEVSWWVGHQPGTVVGPCPHSECEHLDVRTIAYGPDYAHYELHECTGCRCRGWYGEYPRGDAAPIRIWPKRWTQVEGTLP